MSTLVDRDIKHAINVGAIKISPFDERALGTNSYDVHLADTLLTYEQQYDPRYYRAMPLDARKPNPTVARKIPVEGYVLEPGELYLASTVEYTESHEHLPILNGRSSIGRLGLSIHVTAGTGDVGFCGHWTMELFVIRPLRVYAGMAIGQLLWQSVSSKPIVTYDKKRSAKYNNTDSVPQASKLHKDL